MAVVTVRGINEWVAMGVLGAAVLARSQQEVMLEEQVLPDKEITEELRVNILALVVAAQVVLVKILRAVVQILKVARELRHLLLAQA